MEMQSESCFRELVTKSQPQVVLPGSAVKRTSMIVLTVTQSF